MSYDLFLYFDKPVSRKAINSHFNTRDGYEHSPQATVYSNEQTGVYFAIDWTVTSRFLRSDIVTGGHVNVNYFRPSFFGMEAEEEVSALVAAFSPRIEDPQLEGMGTGPYSPSGFLSGWRAGNAFAYGAIGDGPHPYLWPAAGLLRIWNWNRNAAKLQRQVRGEQFVPRIFFGLIHGKLSSYCVWTEAVPSILPQVDKVLLGSPREGSDQFQTVVAPWKAVVDLAVESGFEVRDGALHLDYRQSPAALAALFEGPIEHGEWLEQVSMDQVLDRELYERERAGQKDR